MNLNELILFVVLIGVAAFGGYTVFHRGSPARAPAPSATLHSSPAMLTLSSPVFEPNGTIPAAYTCDAQGAANPPLRIEGVPSGTQSLVLIMEDPDIPDVVKQSRGIAVFDHWVLFNISPSTKAINPGDSVGVLGANSAGTLGYTGPCPPSQYEPKEHRYIFTLYALDTLIELPQGATKQAVLDALQGHAIGQTTLTGRYARP